MGSSDELHDYLVRARAPATLVRALEFIANDPGFTLLRRMGSADLPHTLVVSMSDAGAERLRQHFSSELIVERDRPLSLF
jgi:hypothetical protein